MKSNHTITLKFNTLTPDSIKTAPVFPGQSSIVKLTQTEPLISYLQLSGFIKIISGYPDKIHS